MPIKFREEFKTVGFFYVMTGIYWVSIGFMAAYWTLYFVDLGLNYSSIALVFLMYPISSLIFEIPTGAIADVFGRKISVFLSYLITGLAFVGILLSGSNLPLLMLFYFIAGISFTLETGALEAWFVDTIKHKKKSEQLHRFFGRWGGISSLGFVIGPFLGGILVRYGFDKAFWATSIGMIILAFFVLIFGKEDYFERKDVKIRKVLIETVKTGKRGFKHAFSHPIIFTLTVIMTLLTFATTISYNSYQPYVVQVGLPPQFLGFALSIAGFITIFSLNYSQKIVKFVGGNKSSLALFTFLFGIAILGIGFAKYLPVLFLSMIAYTSIGEFAASTAPAFRELFNKFVPSNIRATVLSVNSFNMKIGEIFGLVAFGLISDYLDLKVGIILSGFVITLISLIYLKIKNHQDSV